jgi:hypothetical protein
MAKAAGSPRARRHDHVEERVISGAPGGTITEGGSRLSGELAGRLAVVTGGSSGIGEACAIRLAGAGASVVLADINAG